MKRVCIVQYVARRTNRAVMEERRSILANLEKENPNEHYVLVDNLIRTKPHDNVDSNLWLLGEAIMMLSEADILVLGKGYEKDTNPCIIHDIAKKYGIEIIEV